MANLLSYTPSFDWQDSKIDRSQLISNLNAALVEAKGLNDNLIKSPSLNDINLPWGNFLEFVFAYGYDETARVTTFPWMTEMHHTTLVNILVYLKNTSDLGSNDIQSLKDELNSEECSYVGFAVNPEPKDYVFSIDSWTSFHRKIVSNFKYEERCRRFPYFNRFFQHGLTQDRNQINQSIYRGNEDDIFDRIDSPHIPGQQIHMHFHGNENHALNVDGSWHHEAIEIPVSARERLSEWGFKLPIALYQI